MKSTFIFIFFIGFAVSAFGQTPPPLTSPCEEVNPSYTQYFRDQDGDGYGTSTQWQCSASQPSGYVSNALDCDDNNSNVPHTNFWADTDGDGYGDPGAKYTTLVCSAPSGYVSNDDDCDDTTSSIKPGAVEICDGIDNDCDGLVDENTVDMPLFSSISITNNCGNTVLARDNPPNGVLWYWQSSATGTETQSANAAATITLYGGDRYYLRAYDGTIGCWSTALTVLYNFKQKPQKPTVQEINNNCGSTELVAQPTLEGISSFWQTAATGQEMGPVNANRSIVLTGGNVYYLRNRDDNTGCWSDATQVNYTVDQSPVWYLDADGDMHAISSTNSCDSPGPGYTLDVLPLDDCDDTNANAYQNEDWYLDSDGDGHAISYTSSCGSPGVGYTLDVLPLDDCNDGDSALHPGTVWYLDMDGDGHAVSTSIGCSKPGDGYTISVLPLGDCDDSELEIHPGTVWYADFDNDGLGDPSETQLSCTQPTNYVLDNTDQCPTVSSSINSCNVLPLSSDPQDHNYVYTRSYQYGTAEIVDPQFFTQNDTLIQEITYVDGLGRPIQQLAIAQTSNASKDDIIAHIGYDDFGRQVKEWLPYADSDPLATHGSFRPDAEMDVNTYYETNYSDDILASLPNPYTEKELEPSPLNRVLKQAAPGKDWGISTTGDDHTIEFEYQSNATDEVRMFAVETQLANDTYSPTLIFLKDDLNVDIEYYPAGTLFKTITYDENHPGTVTKNHTTEEFKDKQGRVVLKRTYADMDTDGNGTIEGEVPHDTYYVYDDYGNLTYVLPPKMDATTETLANINSGLDGLGYQYVYDHRNRLVEKKIPGKEWEHIVYNKLDQPIMTQDGIQRANDEWLFTKYDALGRVAYTGKVTDGRAREVIQTGSVDVLTADLWVKQGNSYPFGSIDVNYDNGAYPTANITEILTINYYDDHDFDRANEPTPPTQVFSANIDHRTKGLATGSKVKVLGENHWITMVTRYDAKGRPIYTYSENSFLGTVDIVKTKLDFVGKPVKVHTSHTRNGSTIATLDNFEYDHVGRLLKQTQCIGNQNLGYDCSGSIVELNPIIENETVDYNITAPNSITLKPVTTISGTPSGLTFSIDPSVSGTGGEEELIVLNEYDELGQLVRKKVGNTEASPLQTVDYTYNIRGWLKQINDPYNLGTDLFGFRISYNEPEARDSGNNPYGTPLYNGNISETIWHTANDASSVDGRAYFYEYDALNRLEKGDYIWKDSSDSFYRTDNASGVALRNEELAYDKNGNIVHLKRGGSGNSYGYIDDLAYAYDNGNKLLGVTDSGTDADPLTSDFKDVNPGVDYTYDANGNMTQDLNKGTSITYNHLNLPTTIAIGSENILYVYDATGTKLQKTVSGGGSVTDYAGNFVYSNSGAGTNFEFFSHPEGYVASDGMGGYDYVYQYKDHLGNIRLSYTDGNNDGSIDTNTEIVEENNYYPFGLKHKGYNEVTSSYGNSVAQKWKFGGKEYDDSFDINTYDFGARNYDPALGRWMNLDPLAEQMRRHSPYNYAFDNPLRFIDPDGMMPRESSIFWGRTDTETNRERDEDEPVLEGNQLAGYRYESGQTAQDITTDINSKGLANHEVNVNEIINSNPGLFDEEGNVVGEIDEGNLLNVHEVLTIDKDIATLNAVNEKLGAVNQEIALLAYEIPSLQEDFETDSVAHSVFEKNQVSKYDKDRTGKGPTIGLSLFNELVVKPGVEDSKNSTRAAKIKLGIKKSYKNSLMQKRESLKASINRYKK